MKICCMIGPLGGQELVCDRRPRIKVLVMEAAWNIDEAFRTSIEWHSFRTCAIGLKSRSLGPLYYKARSLLARVNEC